TLTCERSEVQIDASGSFTESGKTEFRWSNHSVDSSVLITSNAGINTLTLIDKENGCKMTDTIEVIEDKTFPDAIISPSLDSGLKPLDVTLVDQSFGGDTILWDLDDNGFTSSDSIVEYTYEEFATYNPQLIVTDTSSGCQDSTTATIIVDVQSELEVPNVFTPNDDGMNDMFKVTHENIVKFKAKIFNRWGQKIYQWNTVNGGWNGFSTADVEQPERTYYYDIVATGADGKEYHKTGSVMLTR
ncbi:MAG: gliding motility-associated C-terminal domain-containing protein, partial [Flavobacteriales bacterium]